MNYLKTNPKGIDAALQPYQTKLWNKLRALWGMDDDKYLCYGRCYRNQKKDGYVPEMYVGSKEYKDLFFDDTLSAISFFGCEEKTIKNGLHFGDAHLIFLVDLSKIKFTVTHRADEEAIQGVYLLLKNYGELVITDEISGIDNVFREYSGWNKTGGISLKNMQPLLCFRLNFTINYNPAECALKQINKF